MKISKELVSAVLGFKVLDVEIHDNQLVTMLLEDDSSFINIHELGNKCKFWADTQSYKVESSVYYHEKGENIVASACASKRICGTFYSEYSIQSPDMTEPEAIFFICQKILKNA